MAGATSNAWPGYPLWATVEHFAGPPPIFLHLVMRSLRSVTPSSGFRGAMRRRRRAVTRLDVGYLRPATGAWGGLATRGDDAAGVFAGLRAVLDRFAERTFVFA